MAKTLTRRTAAAPHPELSQAVTITRFWRLVSIKAPEECWPWQGDADKGYGVFFYNGKMMRATELALSFWTGEKRHPSLDTCHSCDNPICVNPAHLRFDTRQSNVNEMHERGRARHASKITEEDIVLIRERRALGASQKDLAKDFGLTDSSVSMIVRGIRWPNAGGPIQTERMYQHGR